MFAVEWKSLEELGNFYGGLFGKSKEDFQDGNAKFVTYMNVYSNMSLDFTIVDMVKVGEDEKQNSIKYGDILFTGSSETPDDCGMSCVVTRHIDEPIYLNSFCFGFRFDDVEKFEPDFLKHYFRCIAMRKAISLTASGVTRFNVSKKRFGKIQIPLLHVSKQQEIVSHLDTFTTLISNLESELDMRRKQYEHYRNQLLDFEGVEGVEWKTLGEVCDFIRGPFGGALKKEMFVKEGYAIYEQQHAIYGDWIFRYFINDDKFHQMKRFEVKAGEILMSCSGTMGKTSIVPENPIKGIINQALLKLSVKEIATNKFVKAFMDSSWFQKGLSQNTSGGAIQNVASVSILKTLEIPVPSLKAQQEIVEKLDAFENLIQSLEHEIKLRKQQYEYYREKLLTFEKE